MALKRLIIAAVFAVFSVGAAQADLKVCNKTRYTQGISIGYKEGSRWVSEGWWNINRGKCATVVGGDLKQRYYYYRAEVDGGPFNGSGYYFCTSSREYTIHGDTNCRGRGYDREDFREIDTGATSKSFTLTLVPG
jgi:uncharacterized membrane protein